VLCLLYIYTNACVHSRENQQTSAVFPLLSNSFGSEPLLSKRCNNRSSFLVTAKHVVMGMSILPRASMASVSAKITSIPGYLDSCKCCESKYSTCHKVLVMKKMLYRNYKLKGCVLCAKSCVNESKM